MRLPQKIPAEKISCKRLIMNGRIQELSKQAYELQRHKHGGYFTQQLLLDAFAELIVRECAGVCFEKYANSDQMSKQCGINFANDIKRHFGVE